LCVPVCVLYGIVCTGGTVLDFAFLVEFSFFGLTHLSSGSAADILSCIYYIYLPATCYPSILVSRVIDKSVTGKKQYTV
jgi:hypothetical protein